MAGYVLHHEKSRGIYNKYPGVFGIPIWADISAGMHNERRRLKTDGSYHAPPGGRNGHFVRIFPVVHFSKAEVDG
jgi:hypothetical protein